jgi:hypothetical protein
MSNCIIHEKWGFKSFHKLVNICYLFNSLFSHMGSRRTPRGWNMQAMVGTHVHVWDVLVGVDDQQPMRGLV